MIEAGYGFPSVVHPTAYVEPSAKFSPGVQVFPLAYVGSEVEVGFGSIVNTGVIVSHECILGDIVNISARLESVTKLYNVGIIISERVKEQLGNAFETRFIDKVALKGKNESINIYEVYEHEPEKIKEMKRKMCGKNLQ